MTVYARLTILWLYWLWLYALWMHLVVEGVRGREARVVQHHTPGSWWGMVGHGGLWCSCGTVRGVGAVSAVGIVSVAIVSVAIVSVAK